MARLNPAPATVGSALSSDDRRSVCEASTINSAEVQRPTEAAGDDRAGDRALLEAEGELTAVGR